MRHISAEIEAPVIRAIAWNEEAGVGGIGFKKSTLQLTPDFVIRLTDARPHDSGDSRSVSAEALHGSNCRFEHAGKCAFPSGVCRANHTRFRIGEQNGRAVGG